MSGSFMAQGRSLMRASAERVHGVVEVDEHHTANVGSVPSTRRRDYLGLDRYVSFFWRRFPSV